MKNDLNDNYINKVEGNSFFVAHNSVVSNNNSYHLKSFLPKFNETDLEEFSTLANSIDHIKVLAGIAV